MPANASLKKSVFRLLRQARRDSIGTLLKEDKRFRRVAPAVWTSRPKRRLRRMSIVIIAPATRKTETGAARPFRAANRTGCAYVILIQGVEQGDTSPLGATKAQYILAVILTVVRTSTCQSMRPLFTRG